MTINEKSNSCTSVLDGLTLPNIGEAGQLQRWRKSKWPAMNTNSIWDEIQAHRKQAKFFPRKPERIKRFLDAVILDLWVAATHEGNPWRGYSRKKEDYSKETRYNKIFLTYELLIPLIDDLEELGYVEQVLGDKQKTGLRTRMKATSKLLDTCTAWDIAHVYRADDIPDDETLIFKNADGQVIDYPDTHLTHMWRKQLGLINAKLGSAVITVPGVKCDTSTKRLFRVFNDSSWVKGGRFYGGFWIGLKQRELSQRELIRIDGQPCCELDFKATHASMAYNMQGLPAPDDSYIIPGFDRKTIKDAFLVLFNCEGRKATLDAMRHEKHIKDSEGVLTAIEKAHPAIKGYFHQREMGLQLQQLDALIAAGVMNDLYKAGIVCLPIHDSFIVQTQHEQTLRTTMNKWWKYHFNYLPIIDKKY